MGTSIYSAHRSFQPEVLVTSKASHNTTTSLGGQLLGFDFSVEYKTGNSNTVADALSRRDTDDSAILAISGPRFEFIDRLRLAHDQEPALVALKEEIASDLRRAPWTLIDGMVAF